MGAANRQSPAIPRKFVALYHRKTKIRIAITGILRAEPLFGLLDRGREKRAFKVCEVRTSGLYSQVCFLSSNKFFECKHPFIDKTDGFFYQNEGKDMTISQPSSILYPGNKQYKFVKSLSCLCQNRTSERKL